MWGFTPKPVFESNVDHNSSTCRSCLPMALSNQVVMTQHNIAINHHLRCYSKVICKLNLIRNLQNLSFCLHLGKQETSTENQITRKAKYILGIGGKSVIWGIWIYLIAFEWLFSFRSHWFLWKLETRPGGSYYHPRENLRSNIILLPGWVSFFA